MPRYKEVKKILRKCEGRIVTSSPTLEEKRAALQDDGNSSLLLTQSSETNISEDALVRTKYEQFDNSNADQYSDLRSASSSRTTSSNFTETRDHRDHTKEAPKPIEVEHWFSEICGVDETTFRKVRMVPLLGLFRLLLL